MRLTKHLAAAVALLGLLATVAPAQELDEHLRFLEPLMGKVWEGGYVGQNVRSMRITLEFEAVLDGMAISYVREAAAVDYRCETRFYWHPERGEVCFLSLNSRGIAQEGVAEAEFGHIVLRGRSHWPDGSIETKTTLKIGEDGTLTDTMVRREEDRWVEGHIQEFIGK